MLVSCGALETAHGAALHTDRLFIARGGISGATAERSHLEHVLRPLRSGWVHELWSADLMIVGATFIAHPQLEPRNARLHVSFFLSAWFCLLRVADRPPPSLRACFSF